MAVFMRTNKRVPESAKSSALGQNGLVELREHPREVLLLGLNHRGADVALRERFALDATDCRVILKKLLEPLPGTTHDIIEAVAYSTCNRVEVVAAVVPGTSAPAFSSIEALLSTHSGVAAHDVNSMLYRFKGSEAIQHLFKVGAGLDSMVLGEPQVLGQLKEAYQLAHQLGATRAVLNRMFQQAFSVAKAVRTKTKIGRNAVSVCYAAKELARQIFGDLSDASLMLLGAGDTGALALKHFCAAGVKQCYIVNKTFAKAAALAEPFGGAAVDLSHYQNILPHADIVIGASSLPQGSKPIISQESVEEALRLRPGNAQFYIDLAVPRNFDADIDRVADAFLYNIDDLQDVVSRNIDARSLETERAEVLIDQEVLRFDTWLDARRLEPLIRSVQVNHQHFAKQEIKKTLRRMRREGFDESQCLVLEEMLDSLSTALTGKILHRPLSNLKKTGVEDKRLAEHFEKLFLRD